MKKQLLTSILALLTTNVLAITYDKISNFWPNPVVVTVGGTTVTVTESGGNGTGNKSVGCGIAPYQIGKLTSDWYNYTFSPGITHIRLRMVRIHDDDSVRILVNGVPYTNYINTLSAYAGTCGAGSAGIATVNGGIITTVGTPTGVGSAVQIDIEADPFIEIANLRVEHLRHVNNSLASDVMYDLEIASDSCELKFEATVDDPACSGRDIQLTATNMPNTTYAWTSIPTPNWSPSFNVRDPKLLAASILHSGQYIVTGTRGVCTYKDTVIVNVALAPKTGTPIQTGPVCPGENDTIKLPTLSAPIGGVVHAYGTWGSGTFDATNGYIYVLNNIQASQAGFYNIYVEIPGGCVSDTIPFELKVKPQVTAAFTFKLTEGCEEDIVEFTDLSVYNDPNQKQSWNFADGTPLGTGKTPKHSYIVPRPNYTDRNFNVTLIATNGQCSDTLPQNININHPVKAGFVIDDDSICQGGTINFTADNDSYVKPGTVSVMLWKFGDGQTDNTINTSHTYELAGIHRATFTMTDYLGCADSFMLPIVVDSIGFVHFDANNEKVCVGEEIIFKADYSDYGYVSAVWTLGDGVLRYDTKNFNHSFNKPGEYDVTFDIDYRICPDVSFTGKYTVKPLPTVYLGEDLAICPHGEPVYLGDLGNPGNLPGIKYYWNTSNKDVSQGIYVRHPGVYAVTADLDGCMAADSVVVRKDCYIDIPNAFTPNGDGNSDYFLPRQLLSKNVKEFSMQIYNRWGQQIFATTAVDGRGWDGRYKGEDQQLGVYVYTIQVTFGNGAYEKYQGNVTLLR